MADGTLAGDASHRCNEWRGGDIGYEPQWQPEQTRERIRHQSKRNNGQRCLRIDLNGPWR
jgi:hypothetical protein